MEVKEDIGEARYDWQKKNKEDPQLKGPGEGSREVRKGWESKVSLLWK